MRSNVLHFKAVKAIIVEKDQRMVAPKKTLQQYILLKQGLLWVSLTL